MPWAAEGLVRKASAEVGEGGSDNFQEADSNLQQAFNVLNQSQQDRVLALANLTMASLRNQQGRTAEILQPARAAEPITDPTATSLKPIWPLY